MNCLAYKALERFRRTKLAAKLFYFGVPVTTVRADCTVVGEVVSIEGRTNDGDVNFDMRLDDSGELRHCEVTPCAPAALRGVALTLRPGQRVRVSGEERYEPAHIGSGRNTGGWLEIHPVRSIDLEKEQTHG